VAHANVALVFCGVRTWVTFRTFVLETCWWHGAPVRVPPLCCKVRGGHRDEQAGPHRLATSAADDAYGVGSSLHILDGVDLTPSAGNRVDHTHTHASPVPHPCLTWPRLLPSLSLSP
jgi:hypothetical protein